MIARQRRGVYDVRVSSHTSKRGRYVYIHRQVQREYGPASFYLCGCGRRAQHWHNTKFTGLNPNIEDYDALCAKCHKLQHKVRKEALKLVKELTVKEFKQLKRGP